MRVRGVMMRAFIIVAPFVVAGCLFAPPLDENGYTECLSDSDCAAGTSCAVEVKLCAPPPWHDEGFRNRRLITVNNPGERKIDIGTAVPVFVGGERAHLELDDVPADHRISNFDERAQRWSVTGVFRDLFADRFTMWLPVQTEVPAGGAAALGWLEYDTEDGTPTIVEEPASAFTLFDDLDDFPDDEDGGDTYLINAPGAAAPIVGDGKVVIGDNVTVIWRKPLLPPIEITFVARVNGTNCEEVFIGLTGDDAIGFNPPSAGFFVDTDLVTTTEVAPTANSNPTGLQTPRTFSEQPNALHRFTVAVDGAVIRSSIDDVVFDERRDLRPPFADDVPLFATVQVGGACSIDIETMWATTLPAVTPPTVTVGDEILFNSTF